MNYLVYQRDHLIWSEDYLALDTSFNVMSKVQFLEQLTTGRFLPLKIKTDDGSFSYQLYRLEKSVDKDIVSTIRYSAQTLLHYTKMEGIPIPDFNFVDLDNKIYNYETAKDKIVILNCWFVNCKPCVEEMPGLNQIVKQFKNRKDIIFLALALDPVDDIRNFLKNNIFNYKIIPNKEDYLKNVLKIAGYPTQVVINRRGEVVKVIESSKLEELKKVINRELNR